MATELIPELVKLDVYIQVDVPLRHHYTDEGPSVGDSPQVYMHHISGGSKLVFELISKLAFPVSSASPPIAMYTYYTYGSGPSLPTSFPTAFSAPCTKFAVAGQEGMVVVWDVKNSEPMKTF
ncbi:hypothetical protein JAAARDRAFT_197715 [Jaapia argillacea MUCL 33604]|uniref:Uncharacterized protein n=1 Tax=Jaapia argillacea MUCL 33604 TaxID=933084 RepID=A0A067PSE4_9AGAM|nr:hypothetical protein JAAARDRAFT_197715 [Jaapia argillacea MUCL 33604]